MIKANELRIGNLFRERDRRGRIVESGWFSKNGVSWVSTINHHGVNETSDMGSSHVTQFKDMYPIDLTEEWLLKCGFHELYRSDFSIRYELLANPKIEYKWNKTFGWNLYCQDWCIEGIKHVHQLQNLYFALTGEELSL